MRNTIVLVLVTIILFSCKKEEDINSNIPIEANSNFSKTEMQVYNWFKNQQLASGLVPTLENGAFISTYDQALSAMVFMLNNDYVAAEKIFNYFDARIETELKKGVGGFSMLRRLNGTPLNHRWMGDNAWLLIAINNYKQQTGKNTYDNLATELTNWLLSLQDLDGIGVGHDTFDGGFWAGFDSNNKLLNYKVTEGNIDAYNAILGYNKSHKDLLHFLKNTRWNNIDKNLTAYPKGHNYEFAMDLHPWAYLIFKDYPLSTLKSANRYRNTQTDNLSQNNVTGYCFDVDKDLVWLEGSGMMALAFGIAEMDKEFYLAEMEKTLIQSTIHSNSVGFPYVTNEGSSFENQPLWDGSVEAYSKIAVSGGAWYMFAKNNFNPFAVGQKIIPDSDKFWTD